jgi:hypothetical protein
MEQSSEDWIKKIEPIENNKKAKKSITINQ